VLATLVNAVDPGAVVFGGGLGLRAAYRDRVVTAMRAGIYDPAARELPTLRAALGADAGIIGAALAAWPPRAPRPRGPAGAGRR
jgi:predicted NBD/HSP70 family sugar kinase